MCNTLLKEGTCKDGYLKCKFAHNPCQLNLVITEKEKNMLNNTQRAIFKKKKKSKPLVPWRPTKSGAIEKIRGRGNINLTIARLKPPKKLKNDVLSKFMDSKGLSKFMDTSPSRSKERRTKSEKRFQSKSRDLNKINLFHEI